ncbi:MAG: hypothetical protein ABSG98_04235 [Anaerolineales bacterium]
MEIDLPFRILRTFFSKIRVQRPDTPIEQAPFELRVEANLRPLQERHQYQLRYRVRSVDPKSAPVNTELEAISVFEYCGEGEPIPSSIARFVNERLLFVLAAMTSQMVGSLTAQMGISPTWIPIPLAFRFTEPLVLGGQSPESSEASLREYQESIRRELVIDLAGENPIQVTTGAQVPRIDVWFRVANFGLLDLDLIHLVADVWFGQPTIKLALDLPQKVSARSEITVRLEGSLTEAQSKQIASYDPDKSGGIHIYLTAIVQTRGGEAKVEKNIERRRF